MTPEFLKTIPTNDALKARFDFIDNETLKGNVVIYFRYIIFLLSLSQTDGVDSLAYSLYKDIIVYTASIVESLLEHSVRREILLGRVDKRVFGTGKRAEVVGEIRHECDGLFDEKLRVVKERKYFKFESSDRIDFKDAIHAAKEAGILDEKLHKAAEELRKKRNTIHLSTLNKSSDEYFKKEDVDKAFRNASDIILSLEQLYMTKNR